MRKPDILLRSFYSLLAATILIASSSSSFAEEDLAKDMAARVEGPLQSQTKGFLNSLDRIQKVATMNPELAVGESRNCLACDKPEPVRFMQCSEKNDYLESRLDALSSTSPAIYQLLLTAHAPVFKSSCLRLAMDQSFNEDSASFKSCNASGKAIKVKRPCVSNNYFNLMEQSLNLVSSCMIDYLEPSYDIREKKADLRELFGMLTVESGMHVNAVSGTGPGGPGQLYGGAITDVNKNDLGDIRLSLYSNANKQCGALADLMLQAKTPMRSNNICDRISLERGNPMLNLIYTFAYQKRVRDLIKQSALGYSKYSSRFKNMSAEEKSKLLRAVTVWAHNTGPAGITVPINAVLNSTSKSFSTAKEFLDLLKVQTVNHPHPANASADRRKETSKYYGSITNSINLMESVNGGSCLAN